jgi:hypothetical protein
MKMTKIKICITWAAIVTLLGCQQTVSLRTSKPFGASVPITSYLEMDYVYSPFLCETADLPPQPNPKFDLYIPQVSLIGGVPRPLVIFVHGGGYTGGDKSDIAYNKILAPEVKKLLEAGYAFATTNYRLLSSDCAVEKCGVRDKCMDDVVRFLLYIKSQAATYGIDKERVGFLGVSAGATICNWIAFKGFDSKAVVNSFGAPLDAESTDIRVIVNMIGQADLDLEVWDTEVFDGSYLTNNLNINTIKNKLNSSDPCYVHKIYGYGDQYPSSILNPITDAYRQEVTILDRINSFSADFPDFYVINTNKKNDLNSPNAKILNHHPLQAVAMIDHASPNPASAGKLFYYIPKISPPDYIQTGGYTSIADFFLAKL